MGGVNLKRVPRERDTVIRKAEVLAQMRGSVRKG